MDLSAAIMEVTLKELANYDVLQYLEKLKSAGESGAKKDTPSSK